MFSSLTSYIWSSRPEDQTVPDISDENVVEQGEDEWVLVDFVNKKSDENETDKKRKQSAGPVQQSDNVLEESWYVTPPSCFNASQEDFLSLQTSPLENLLIEHPSMSVYGGANEAWVAVEQSVAEETPDSEDENSSENAVETRAHSHRRAVRTVDKDVELTRHVQKKVLDQNKKQYRKKKLQKQNQTHIRVTRSRRRQKKDDRKQSKHSTVYSNRGC
ncbi:tumor protein p53-inducible nuclear protein 2-like [Dendronephthya gigantea]|uniref:tumor protein p53-inducible nuclear protein 2-like n=1 Tax=Dendronephthya gigantea TaxID=151771 RepID=UPI00106B499A|nr:tumor protein p53-inducible nuclear protein 2-like [Dendronephthya gigantea]